ncbi:MAG: LD-carboxypeptidase [Muribaculaceae bacterium]|nr:LD-carboxypeptidase [Muribaculaceae bacterium]
MSEMFFPAPLKEGDKIAIVSPASMVKDEYVYGAMSRMLARGYEPVLMKYALGHEDGNFAASKGDRLMDLFSALENQEYKAIFCSRGGYGCAQLLANFSKGMIAGNPKWIIGYSDISALLALWYSSGIASIHGPMAKHLAINPADDPSTEALFNILETGGRFDYTVAPHQFNQLGKSTGVIRGGNMAVLTDLAGTPYDLFDSMKNRDSQGVILFFEDIAEPIYKVNRMLWRLALSGSLMMVKGIIFGQFTEYKPDKNFDTMEDMIKHFIDQSIVPRNIPIVYNFPVGHTDLNYPITEGAEVELDVTETRVRLRTLY